MGHHDFIKAVLLGYSCTDWRCVELEERLEQLSTAYERNAGETLELL